MLANNNILTKNTPLKCEVNGELVNGRNSLERVLLVAEADYVARSVRVVGCQHTSELLPKFLQWWSTQ